MLLLLSNVVQDSEFQLPETLVKMLRAQVGDTISVVETEGGIELRRFDEERITQMQIVHEIVNEDREVMRRLAE